jgi:DNA-binding XRE family transcriptional regulator
MDTKRIQNAPIRGFVSFRMNKQQVSERLRALATGDEHRSKTARLRDVYADVEIALKAGVSRATVLKELDAAGLKMSMASFTGTLQRIRAAMKSQQKGNAVPAQSSNKAITEIEENNISENRSDPARITAIMRSTPDLDALAKAGKLDIKEMKK